ncbi:MAG: LysR family transcriptional regulator [Pseudomonadota bacterium]
MKHALPSLEALKVFESAARYLSFSDAAEELCVSKAAVSYQIRKLETELDCALFRRTVRQVFLTDAGQELLQVTQRLFTELGTTLDQLGATEKRSDVSVGATTYVAVRWLSARISRFSETHPGVSIVLQHAVNSDEFRVHDVDVAIRWSNMAANAQRGVLKTLPMPLFPVCAPALLERLTGSARTGPLKREQLGSAPFSSTALLCEERSLDLWREWYGPKSGSLTNPRRVIADANVRTQAAVDGLGWTMADGLMKSELDSGALVAPFAHELKGYGYLIQAPPGRYCSRAAAALRAWLVEAQ